MKTVNIKLYKVIFNISLIIICMAIVFIFSSEQGKESRSTSRKVTETIVQIISDKPIEENEELVHNVDKVVRKLAHYTIYTVLGFVLMNFFYNTDKSLKEKIKYTLICGTGYAITDEIHQLFVSERSARLFDVGIDTLGVITGISIYLIAIKIIKSIKNL